mmetsp:Transcript_39861/g.98590  ORF Transcript_39861/g.98590 Transcript_39861/m.98590 type:complete len:221 (+) Transcript_39861:1980-2642(+)
MAGLLAEVLFRKVKAACVHATPLTRDAPLAPFELLDLAREEGPRRLQEGTLPRHPVDWRVRRGGAEHGGLDGGHGGGGRACARSHCDGDAGGRGEEATGRCWGADRLHRWRARGGCARRGRERGGLGTVGGRGRAHEHGCGQGGQQVQPTRLRLCRALCKLDRALERGRTTTLAHGEQCDLRERQPRRHPELQQRRAEVEREQALLGQRRGDAQHGGVGV